MKVFLFVLLLCGFAFAADPPTVVSTCTARVTLMPQSPTGVLKAYKPEVFELATCDDVKFQGGGVVIRALDAVWPPSGKYSIHYYPAHKLESVTVTPKE